MKLKFGKRTLAAFLAAVLCLSAASPMARAQQSGQPEGAAVEGTYDISFDTGTYPGGLNFGETNDQYMRGQTFVAVNGGKMTAVEVSIGKTPGVKNDVVAELFACDESGNPTGRRLAAATLPKEEVAEHDTQTERGYGIVSIPLAYDSLEKGKMYIVKLGQSEEASLPGYRWQSSSDVINHPGDWWHSDFTNPQIKQQGFDGDLKSLKFGSDGGVTDESRCGDLWMKVHYETPALAYDVSFDSAAYPGGLNFGENNDQYMRGQAFVAVEGGDMSSVEVNISKTPGVVNDVLAELYACDENGVPTGERLASAALSKDAVADFDMDTERGFAVATIPLSYSGLEKGKMYMVKLGQQGEATNPGYRWNVSADVLNNPNWWHSDVVNPQVRQQGYDGDLKSLKFGSDGGAVDESRCGDLWLKVNYTNPAGDGGGEEPGKEEEPKGLDLKQRFEADMANGGESFYMDRVLARTGVDPSLIEDSGLMTRGRALYVKGTNTSGLITEFGFDGVMRYVKGDQAGYAVKVNGQAARDFYENTSERTDTPSHWTSSYFGKENTANDGIEIVERRFITDYNVAVTVLDIKNNTEEDKEITLSIPTPVGCEVKDETTLGKTIYVDYRNIDVKLSMDGGKAGKDGIVKNITVPAGETVSQKAQMGFIDPKSEEAVAEYQSYCEAAPADAYKTHVQHYNAWWVENIPYVEVPDDAINKMIAYRWWIARFNMADMESYNYPFPTSMEGVFGYNNAIVNAIPWQLDEMRYLRSPLNAYSTWATAMIAAEGGAYHDNPAGLWWERAPQHYISVAAWDNYKVHGGNSALVKAMAGAGAGDVLDTQSRYDPNKDFLYDIQYDAWDADTASLAVRGEQDRVDTASFAWANANAVAQMYAFAGDSANAKTYAEFAEKIKKTTIDNLWDSESGQFLMRMRATGEFNPFRDINNYYGYLMGMVPTTGEYDKALDVWSTEGEFGARPMYISNSKDFLYIQSHLDEGYDSRSRNYSAGAMGMTLDLYGSIIKNYSAENVDAAAFLDLLEYYTKTCYVNGDTRYPDTNEFFSGDGADNQPTYRSWIHHNWHSQYNTVVIENVFGVTPREDDIIELSPVDIGWDSFTVKNLRYHDSDIDILWDKANGGYQLFVDGVKVAAADKLCHMTWNSETGEVEVLDESGAAVTVSTKADGFKEASAVTYTGRVQKVIDAAVGYKPGDVVVEKEDWANAPVEPEHDASYEVKADSWSDTNWNLDFGDNKSGDQYKRGQMFVATEDGTLTGVQMMIMNKSAKHDATVELYGADENGLPGEVLAKATIPVGSVMAGTMTLAGANFEYRLEKGKTYYIVLGQEGDDAGFYCWLLSSVQGAGFQGWQEGYDGALRSVKITGNPATGDGRIVDESGNGDYYLKVFYQSDKPAPAVDTDALQAEIEKAEKLDLAAYYDDGKDAFKEALNIAKAVLKNPESQAQVDGAKDALEKAAKALKLLPSKDNLSALVKEAQGKDLTKYTDLSADTLRTSLKKAVSVLNDKNASQADIERAVAELKAALDGLKLKETGSGTDGKDPDDGKEPDDGKDPSDNHPTGDSGTAAYPALFVLLLSGAAALALRRRTNRCK